ncbi:MAG: hypothetical protein IH898_13710 [Planctomycetes bacterium]|nr:hypothetical protein [Planctomycetota bacterium]
MPSTLSIGDWLDHWLSNLQRQVVADSTFGQQQWLVGKHIKPHLGERRLTRLTSEHFDWLLAELERLSVGARTRQHVHAVLRKALRIAVEKRRLQISPMVGVEKPRRDQPEIHALSIAEARKLLAQAINDPYEALYVLALHTGMRWGEIAGLQWQDVCWGTPEDVGRAVAVLARGELSYATGNVLLIDGGLTLPRL